MSSTSRRMKAASIALDEYRQLAQVLILGWGEHSFMTMLLRELDRGPAALPRGSELTLFNSRSGLLGQIRDSAQLRNLSVLHVQGNALSQEEIKQKLNLHKQVPTPDCSCIYKHVLEETRVQES